MREPEIWRLRAMPVVAAGLVLSLVLAFWWSQKRSEAAQARRNLELRADAAEREIRNAIDTRVNPLTRMAQRWEQQGGISQRNWEHDATQL